MADGEVAQKPSAGSYSVSPFVKKEVHDQIANRSAKKRVSWNWYDTWHEEHHRAFVVAKLCKADLLQEVHDSLQKAIDEGQTFEEWRKEIQPKLEGRWLGKTVGELWDELPEAEKKRLKEQAQKENRKDPEPNEKQRQEVISPKRLETIYRTNMKVAHVAGQYQSLVDEAELYPYWQYHTQEDDRVRGSHAVLNRKVFRWDDPFWDTHFPPNGWQCRCYVRSLDDDDLEEKSLKVLDSRDLKTRKDKSAGGHTKLTYIIDGKEATTADGWNYNPGKVNQQIDNVADNKIGEYDAELGQQVKDDLNAEDAVQEQAGAASAPASEDKSAAAGSTQTEPQQATASGQPAKPSEPAKKTEPEKKAEPKSAADKTEEPKASGKPKAKPAAPPAKPEAAAPKSTQPTVKDSNVPVKSTAAAPKPAQPAVKPAVVSKPKQEGGAHGEPKPAAVPKPIKPAPAPVNKPAVPRIIEPIKPADPSAHRVVKPVKPIEPSVPRVVEPVKPEVKQSILQTIRGKVSRAVDRVLSWLGVSSKQSMFENLAAEGGQGAYFNRLQSKETPSTVANNAAAAQSQQRGLQTANAIPKERPSIYLDPLKQKTFELYSADYDNNMAAYNKYLAENEPISPKTYKVVRDSRTDCERIYKILQEACEKAGSRGGLIDCSKLQDVSREQIEHCISRQKIEFAFCFGGEDGNKIMCGAVGTRDNVKIREALATCITDPFAKQKYSSIMAKLKNTEITSEEATIQVDRLIRDFVTSQGIWKVSHNHPKGSPLSTEDVKAFASLRLTEIRIVHKHFWCSLDVSALDFRERNIAYVALIRLADNAADAVVRNLINIESEDEQTSQQAFVEMCRTYQRMLGTYNECFKY